MSSTSTITSPRDGDLEEIRARRLQALLRAEQALIQTPHPVSTPSVSTPSVSTPSVRMPSVSSPSANPLSVVPFSQTQPEHNFGSDTVVNLTLSTPNDFFNLLQGITQFQGITQSQGITQPQIITQPPVIISHLETTQPDKTTQHQETTQHQDSDDSLPDFSSYFNNLSDNVAGPSGVHPVVISSEESDAPTGARAASKKNRMRQVVTEFARAPRNTDEAMLDLILSDSSDSPDEGGSRGGRSRGKRNKSSRRPTPAKNMAATARRYAPFSRPSAPERPQPARATQTLPRTATPPRPSPPPTDNVTPVGMCYICRAQPPNALLRCDHAYCEGCANRLRMARKPCPRPDCQQTFRAIKVYRP